MNVIQKIKIKLNVEEKVKLLFLMLYSNNVNVLIIKWLDKPKEK